MNKKENRHLEQAGQCIRRYAWRIRAKGVRVKRLLGAGLRAFRATSRRAIEGIRVCIERFRTQAQQSAQTKQTRRAKVRPFPSAKDAAPRQKRSFTERIAAAKGAAHRHLRHAASAVATASKRVRQHAFAPALRQAVGAPLRRGETGKLRAEAQDPLRSKGDASRAKVQDSLRGEGHESHPEARDSRREAFKNARVLKRERRVTERERPALHAMRSALFAASLRQTIGSHPRHASEAMRALGQALRRGFVWLKTRREAIGYYSVLAIVLAALGTAAYGYRNGSIRETGAPSATIDPARAAQAQPEPTASPEPTEEPFLAPIGGEIIAGYAADELVWSDALGMWQTHPAIDLAASAGEAVVAAADGTVVETYSDPIYGNVIAIDHGGGRVIRYASLNTLQLVEAGQEVARGEVISAAGTCDGEAELGAHVHLEYYVNGAPEDLSAILG